MSILSEIKEGKRTDIPKDITMILEKFEKIDEISLGYMINNVKVRDAIADRVKCLSRMREVSVMLNHEDRKDLNTFLNIALNCLKNTDFDTWHDIYTSGLDTCEYPDYLVQGKIQEKIIENGWHCTQKSTNNYIACTIDREVGHIDQVTVSGIAPGRTPAIVIVYAYISALESWKPKYGDRSAHPDAVLVTVKTDGVQEKAVTTDSNVHIVD